MLLSYRRLLAVALLAALPAAGESRFAAQQAAPAGSSAADKTAAPGPAPSQAAQPPAKPQTGKPAPADDNAFPEAQSEAAAKQAAADESADEKAAASGSAVDPKAAAGEPSSSSRDKFAGIDLLGDNDSRISNGAGGVVLDPKLSEKDVKVGEQYMQMGDYPGAYSRFKEACAVNPGNIEAVFLLAEAARKTAHLDESAENYRIYLQVEPQGSKAKAARKALVQLEGK